MHAGLRLCPGKKLSNCARQYLIEYLELHLIMIFEFNYYER